MKYAYFDASSGLSGDMILGALLDLGASQPKFKKAIDALGLPVRLKIHDVDRPRPPLGRYRRLHTESADCPGRQSPGNGGF